MERVSLLIAVLGNTTALVHNIILRMCRTCRAYHVDEVVLVFCKCQKIKLIVAHLSVNRRRRSSENTGLDLGGHHFGGTILSTILSCWMSGVKTFECPVSSCINSFFNCIVGTFIRGCHTSVIVPCRVICCER